MSKPNDDEYWNEYDGLQHAKHQILRRYLGGWFPILSSWNGRVMYIDCHAGRGRHNAGQEGSPILALRLLTNHTYLKRMLRSAKVSFYFFEISTRNVGILQEEISALGTLPNGVSVHVIGRDYEEELREALDEFKAKKQVMAPAFAFVDPYGFKLSISLLNDFLQYGQSELLINFMYRYINMAIAHESQSANMDELFGCSDWRAARDLKDPEDRARMIIDLFSQQLKARYVTQMYMRGNNGALKYVLFHAANSPKARKLMKEAMWSVEPEGSFTASERNSPDQIVLVKPEPDLEPLKKLLWHKFSGQSVSMNRLYDWLVDELYLDKHLHSVLNAAEKEEKVAFSGYEGRRAFSKNPIVTFVAF